MNANILKGAGLAVFGAALMWWLAASPRLELAATQLDLAQQQIVEARQLDADRVAVIEAQAGQLAAVLENELRSRALLAEISKQSKAHAQALTELKRNDKAIMDYLDQPVPADLGRLYQRAGTADPAAYRQPSAVPADTLPTAGTQSPAGE